MDFVFLATGLAYTFLLPLTWAMARLERPILPWKLLGLFGIFYGASQWLNLLSQSFGNALPLEEAHFLTAAIGYGFLIAFGRISLLRLEGPWPGVRIYGLITLVAIAGLWAGFPLVQAAILYALGWTGAIFSASALWQLAKRKKTFSRTLITCAAGLVISMFMTDWRNQSFSTAITPEWNLEIFRLGFGLPHQWLRLLGSLMAVVSLWRYYWSEYGWPQPEALAATTLRRDRMLSSILTIVAAIAWVGAKEAERTHIRMEYSSFAQKAGFIASFLDEDLAFNLARNEIDIATSDYLAMKHWCSMVCLNTPDASLAYLTLRRNSRSSYLVDSAPSYTPDNSPPGSPYTEPALDYAFQDTESRAFISGPYENPRGVWITAAVPISESKRHNNQDELVFHMNMDARTLIPRMAMARLPFWFLFALVDAIIIGGFVYGRRTLLDSHAQALELERSRRQETAVARLAASNTIASGNLRQAAREITRLAAEILRVSRAGIWLGGIEKGHFECLALFESSTGTFVDSPALDRVDLPNYFETLSLGRTINAPDTWNDERLAELRESYFKPMGVMSRLDSPVLLEGRLAGVLCLEQIGQPRKWMDDEFRFSGEIAEAIARAALSARHKEAEDAQLESERRLTEIISFLPDPTFIIDRNKRVIYWNKAIEMMTGVPAEQMLGRGDYAYSMPFYGHLRPILIDLVFLSDAEIERSYLEVKREGDSIVAEAFSPCLGANGAILWGVARMLKDAEGQFTGAIESVRDVSTRRRMEYALRSAHDELEQRVKERTYELATTNAHLLAEIKDRLQAEERLREANRLLEGMLDGIPDMVGFQLPDHTILRYNHAGYQALGLRPEQAIGRKCYELLGEPTQCQDCASSRALQAKKVVSTERYIARLGCFMECRSNPVLDDQGQVRVIIEQMRDITERKRNEDALRQARDELEQRVDERTAELAATNRSLTLLVQQQVVNIDLAKQVLALIDSAPPRHTPLSGGLHLFVTSYYFPCHAAGGDHFFARNLGTGPDQRTVLSLKDQSGHEVGCVLRSILTDLIHNSLLQDNATSALEKVLGRLNDEICASDLFTEGDFFTSINVEIHHASLELRYLSTGHPPFLLLRDATVVSLPDGHAAGANLPAGMIGNQTLTVGSQKLLAGDKLILFTDGLLETPSSHGGDTLTSDQLREQVQEILRQAPQASISQICQSLLYALGHLSEAGISPAQKDDIAMLGIELEPEAEVFQDIIFPQDDEDLNGHIQRLYQKITQEWHEHKIENPEARLRLVLEEALLNAWRHGNGSDPRKAITIARRYGNDAHLEIADEGAGFNSKSIYDPTSFENLAKPSGRGLFILRMLADEVQWKEPGNRVALYFARTPLPVDTKKGAEARKNRLELWHPT